MSEGMPQSVVTTLYGDAQLEGFVARPEVELVGHDGNAWAILGACREAALRRSKWCRERWEAVRSEMMAGDYDHLIQTAMKYFEVI
jgi:hypothetical protein